MTLRSDTSASLALSAPLPGSPSRLRRTRPGARKDDPSPPCRPAPEYSRGTLVGETVCRRDLQRLGPESCDPSLHPYPGMSALRTGQSLPGIDQSCRDQGRESTALAITSGSG